MPVDSGGSSYNPPPPAAPAATNGTPGDPANCPNPAALHGTDATMRRTTAPLKCASFSTATQYASASPSAPTSQPLQPTSGLPAGTPIGGVGLFLKPNDKGELEIVRLAKGGSAERSGQISQVNSTT